MIRRLTTKSRMMRRSDTGSIRLRDGTAAWIATRVPRAFERRCLCQAAAGFNLNARKCSTEWASGTGVVNVRIVRRFRPGTASEGRRAGRWGKRARLARCPRAATSKEVRFGTREAAPDRVWAASLEDLDVDKLAAARPDFLARPRLSSVLLPSWRPGRRAAPRPSSCRLGGSDRARGRSSWAPSSARP